MENTVLEEIGREVRQLVEGSLEALVKSGGMLKKAREQVENDTEFKKWIETSFGKGMIKMSESLIRCDDIFGEKIVPVPLISPETLFHLATSGNIEDLKQTLSVGSVQINNKTKKIEDLSESDINFIKKQNSTLKKQLMEEKDKVKDLLHEIHKLSKNLRGKIRKNGTDEEIAVLKRTIKLKEEELSKFNNIDIQTDKVLPLFLGELSRLPISDSALRLKLLANNLTSKDKHHIQKAVDTLIDELQILMDGGAV